MGDETKWLMGVGVTLSIFAFGAISTGLYRVWAAITAVGERMKAGDDKLHERINDVRKEYVRRDDLDGHLQRIDRKLEDISADQKEMNRAVLAAIRGGQQ
jgi:uncharacterized protein with von Willebrand factor type A (vWA) domain